MAASKQLSLFAAGDADSELDVSADRELMRRVPSAVLFGTSSWTFPGWAGLVYAGSPTERQLADAGLAEYARHPLFRTVGIDRSYYRPLERPDLERYAEQLPSGFRCVMKVFNKLTSVALPRTSQANPHFLSVAAFEDEVLSPIAEGFSEHVGPLVFEIAPMPAEALPSSRAFAGRLDAFLSRLPREFDYAVELRNRSLFTPRYVDTLARNGVAHVLNLWERMPDIGEQLAAPGVLTAPFVVSRLLIPPGCRYDERREQLAPFDRIVDVQEKMRDDVARLAETCAELGKVSYILVGNKAEGSSPLTVRALAERVAARADETSGGEAGD